ncbi:MAG: hypothetical protein ACPIA7_06965 [Akkermansiaceae bacterium]
MLSVVACAKKRTITKSQVRVDPWGNPERFSVGKDEAGNPQMKSDLRSSFEGKSSNMISSQDFSGKDYTTRSYAKKRWQGNTSFERRGYQGNTDANKYKMEPWFVRKQASAEGEASNLSDRAFVTGAYDKTSASEQSADRISHPSDAETDVRRRVFQQPDIIDWKEQQGLGVKDTNRMLGR